MKQYYTTAIAMTLFAASAAIGAPKQEAVNQADNSGFEDPPGAVDATPKDWTYFTSNNKNMGITSDDQMEGTQCIRFDAQGIADAFQGLNQKQSVQEKKRYTFKAHIKNDRENPLSGPVKGKLVIEWLDGSGREIARSESKMWTRNLTKMRWDDIEIRKAKAPAGAKTALFGIHLFEEGSGAEGSMFVDDIQLTQ